MNFGGFPPLNQELIKDGAPSFYWTEARSKLEDQST